MAKKFRGSYDVVRAVAFTMVMIQHFLVTCTRNDIIIPNLAAEIIRGGVNFGTIGVGLFFLLSGSTLWRNNKENGWKDFYKKHLVRIILPIWISYIGLSIVYYSMNGYLWHKNIIEIVFPLMGLNFFSPILQKYEIMPLNLVGEWFTSVILILYLFYPLIRAVFSSRFRFFVTIVICIIYFGNFFIKIAINHGGNISLTIGLFYFWLGMYFEEYSKKLSCVWLSVIAVLCALTLWINKPLDVFGISYLPNIPIILLLYVASFSIYKTSEILRTLCKYSYVFYLIHHTFMNWLVPAIGVWDMGVFRIGLMFICLMWLNLAIAISENMVYERILTLTKRKRNL